MNRKRNFEDIDWEVTSIKYTGLERPWRVWWSVGGPPSELPTRCLAGISEELKKHAREWEGTEVLLDVTHLRFDEDQLQVKRESKDGWNNVERECNVSAPQCASRSPYGSPVCVTEATVCVTEPVYRFRHSRTVPKNLLYNLAHFLFTTEVGSVRL